MLLPNIVEFFNQKMIAIELLMSGNIPQAIYFYELLYWIVFCVVRKDLHSHQYNTRTTYSKSKPIHGTEDLVHMRNPASIHLYTLHQWDKLCGNT